MNEIGLIEQVFKIINANYSNIYVVDINIDKVYKFEFDDNSVLGIKDTISYTDFIDVAKGFVHIEDLSKYFDAISLNKLETEAIKGNSETKVKYRKLCETGEYRWFVNIINYLPFEGKKLIFMMSEDVNERLTDSEENNIRLESEVTSYKNRITRENESISDAIYQINNLLESNNFNGDVRSNDTKQYINSVFNRVSADHPELNKAIITKLADSTNFLKPSVLIVDDSSIIRNSLKRIFESEFNIIMAKDGNEAIDIITKNVLNSSLNKENNIVGMLLDLVMPGSDGFVVLNFMKNFNLFNKIPVAIISGDETRETRKKVYEYDIVDMLEKPFNTDNIKRRISKIINLHVSSNNLAGIVNNQSKELSAAMPLEAANNVKNIICSIVNNIVSNATSIRLKKMARVLSLELASKYPKYNLTPKYIDSIINGSALYNIGAIALSNNEVLTNNSIKAEIDNGLDIIDLYIEDDEEKKVVSNIIKYSCELYNGNGAPNGIKGDLIPIEAQIVNILVRIIQMKGKSVQTIIKNIISNEADRYNPDIISVLDETKKALKDIN